MTDYSLWNVILNGDSPAPTRVIEGVVQRVAPTTVEQRLARKNELKARGTLLMALPDKHQLKFKIHKDAKTLMEAIKKRFGGNTKTKKVQKTLLKQQYENFTGFSSESLDQIHDRLQKLINLEEQSLDDLFNNLKIYETKVKNSSSVSTSIQNIVFVSSSNTDSSNELISAVASVSSVSAKIHVYALPNVDTLSNAVIYSFFASQSNSLQLDNDDLKEIDADDLEEMDLKWQMAMLTVECYNCHRKGHFAKECRSHKDTRSNGAAEPQRRNVPIETSTSNALVSQCDGVGSYDWRLESVEARLLVYQQNEYVFKKDIKLLKLEVQLRDNALVFLRQNLEKAEQERDDLKFTLEKFQTSSKNLSALLASQTNDKTGTNQAMGIMLFPPHYTGTFMPPKPDLVFHNAPNDVETVHTPFNVELSPTKPDNDMSHTHRPSAPIIEDWVSDSKDESETKIPQYVASFVQPTEQVNTPRPSVEHVETSIPTANPKTAIPNPTSNGNRRNRKACFLHVVPTSVLTQSKLVPITTVRPVTTTVPKPTVTRPRPAKPIVTKPTLPPRRHINRRPSPKACNFPSKVTAVKAPMVNAATDGNPQHDLKEKGVIDSGCLRHITRNMSYLSDFKELNGGYVSFGGNPKGGKISSKGKIRTGKLDFDDVYFVKELKFNLFSVSQMCDKNNSVLFTDTKCLVLSLEFKPPNENQVLLRVPKENNMVLVTKPQNKTPYELLYGRTLSIGFMRPFGCPVTILNTLDSLGKFDGKVDEGFLVGYSISSKAFRVFNSRTRIVQETLHINFLENKPNVVGSGHTWLFDIDTLTKTMNYQPVTAGNQSNPSAFVQEQFAAKKEREENVQQYVLFPVWSSGSINPQNTYGDATFDEKEPEFEGRKPESEINVSPSSSAQSKKHDDKTKREAKGKNPDNVAGTLIPAVGKISTNNTNTFCAAGPSNIVEELLQFKMQTVWVLVDLPHEKRAIEVFAPVVRIEAIRLFLAYASFMGFMVYQMDVKGAFLYETIKEEVYVYQPLGFKDLDYPDKVYKVVKALYGLQQAPRAWQKGEILFIKMQKGEILLVQIYVADIIFGYTNKDLCKAFEKLMKNKFQMSLMGELTFFLGFQVKQKKDGIFISLDKYVADILRKFGLTDGKSASTPIDTKNLYLRILMGVTTRPMAPIIEDWVSDSEDESEPNDPQSIPSFVQTTKHVKPSRHSDQPVQTPILDATSKPTSSKTNVLPKSKPVSVTATRPLSAAIPKIMVTKPRHAHSLNTNSNSINRRHKTRSHSSKTSNSSPKVTAAKASVVSAVKGKKGKWGNPQYALKDKRIIDSGCSRHMTRNMSYLSDFQELNSGYVAFGGNPKSGKISGKGKIKTDFKLPDESQVLLRVPRENNMYNVNLKDIATHGLVWTNICQKPNKKCYCLVITDDYSRFTWVFFLATKDETSPILKSFITGLENQLSLNVKVIKSDNGIEFKNSDLNQFCELKGIKKEFSVPRTPQQNGIAERKNRTLIEAARTMLADSLLPISFWAEAVNTACYVQNRVLVTKPQNKIPYELLHGCTPSIGFMRPFGCHVTILNTLDPLGKFKGKVDKGFLVGYSMNSKAFRVFNSRTCIIQETLHVNFLENKPNIAGNQSNPSASFQEEIDAEKAREEATQQYMLFPVWSTGSSNPQNKEKDVAFDGKEHDAEKPGSTVNISPSSSAQSGRQDDMTKKKDKGKSLVKYFIGNRDLYADSKDYSKDSSNNVSAASPIIPTAGQNYSNSTNPISAVDPSWIEAMQEELLQFKMQKVWILVDLPHGKRAIGTKWVYRNKKDERGIVVRNKARLVAQGHTQEEGINYEEVFAPIARIEAIRLFLAYASFMGFMVYQMDVKSVFLYGTTEEEVYVCHLLWFEDPDQPNKVYKVVKALYSLHQAPRAWYETLANYLLENGFHRG
nr:hypothetical protein [Tanacetum cinerariifolium]